MDDVKRSISDHASEFKRRLVAAPMPLQAYVIVGLIASLGWSLYRIWAMPDAGLPPIGVWPFGIAVSVIWYYWLLRPHYILYLVTTLLTILQVFLQLAIVHWTAQVAGPWTTGVVGGVLSVFSLACLLHKRTRRYVHPTQGSDLRGVDG